MENLQTNEKIKSLESDVKYLEKQMNLANKAHNLISYYRFKLKRDIAQHEIDTERNIERFANTATKTHGIAEVRVPFASEVPTHEDKVHILNESLCHG